MSNTNYLTSIVKILEIPKQKWIKNKLLKVEVRAILPQRKQNKIIHLAIWGELANRHIDCFRPNQYLLIEGFLSVFPQKNSKTKKFNVTVLKIYPIF